MDYSDKLRSLFGVAVGDAFGLPVEFMSREDLMAGYDWWRLYEKLFWGLIQWLPGFISGQLNSFVVETPPTFQQVNSFKNEVFKIYWLIKKKILVFLLTNAHCT
jgi:hypothetical protein